MAQKLLINTILIWFFLENEAEYGNPVSDNLNSLRDKSYYTYENIKDIYLGGTKVSELLNKYKIKLSELILSS